MTVYSQHQPTQNMHWNTLRQKFPKSPQPSQHQLSWFRKRLPSYLGGFESKNRIFPLFSKMDLDKLGNRRFPKFSLVIFGTHDNVAGGLRASSHRFQVLSPKSLEVNPCNLNHWEHESSDLPFHTGPKYDMDATWQHFLEVRFGTCVKSWVK